MDIKVYSKDACPYCVRAKILLEKNGLAYTELKLGRDFQTKEELLKIVPTARSYPAIVIDGVHIGGHDNLVEWFKKRDANDE